MDRTRTTSQESGTVLFLFDQSDASIWSHDCRYKLLLIEDTSRAARDFKIGIGLLLGIF